MYFILSDAIDYVHFWLFLMFNKLIGFSMGILSCDLSMLIFVIFCGLFKIFMYVACRYLPLYFFVNL